MANYHKLSVVYGCFVYCMYAHEQDLFYIPVIGGQFGNAMIFPIGGFLCAYGFDGGWPSVFYVIGESFTY